MRYAPAEEYLIAGIVYLGTNPHWWARSSDELADELSLDPGKLKSVFEGFPSIFRRAKAINERGLPLYCLQMRYAQRTSSATAEPERTGLVPPLATDQIAMLLDFVMHAAQSERTGTQNRNNSLITFTAASVAAIAAVAGLFLK